MTPERTVVTPLVAMPVRRPDPVLRFAEADRAPSGDFASAAVPNALLESEMVPRRGASWAEIEELALSYDGYAYWSDAAELGNRGLQRWTRDRTLPGSLDELRGCLFYEQRRWHHFGEEPHGRGAEYVWSLLDAIRDRVTLRSSPVLPSPPPVLAEPPVLPPPPAPTTQTPTAVIVFSDDDAGYLAWTGAHEHGFVVNASKGSSSKGLKLHRARCSSILAPSGSGRALTSSFRKLCAPDLAALLDWCATSYAAEPDPCLRCKP